MLHMLIETSRESLIWWSLMPRVS